MSMGDALSDAVGAISWYQHGIYENNPKTEIDHRIEAVRRELVTLRILLDSIVPWPQDPPAAVIEEELAEATRGAIEKHEQAEREDRERRK